MMVIKVLNKSEDNFAAYEDLDDGITLRFCPEECKFWSNTAGKGCSCHSRQN